MQSTTEIVEEVLEDAANLFGDIAKPFFSRFDSIEIKGAYDTSTRKFFHYDTERRVLQINSFKDLNQYLVDADPLPRFRILVIQMVLSEIFFSHPKHKTDSAVLMAILIYRALPDNNQYRHITQTNLQAYFEKPEQIPPAFYQVLTGFDLDRLNDILPDLDQALQIIKSKNRLTPSATVTAKQDDDEIDIT